MEVGANLKFMTDESDRLGKWFRNLRDLVSSRFFAIPGWLQVTVVIALVLGICLRFTNLDIQGLRQGERYSMLRTSGYRMAEVSEGNSTRSLVRGNSFIQSPHLKPNSDFGDTIYSLAVEDPQHPPLYYIVARVWREIFGSSVLIIRSLSALISLAIFPGMYWLCWELFKVPNSVPLIAIALVAVSPIQLILAQEAQEYGLWLATILYASAGLLRAIRLQKSHAPPTLQFWSWALYSLFLMASFYTFVLSAFVAVAHGAYVLFITKLRPSPVINGYANALLGALVGYIPWIIVLVNNYETLEAKNAWTQIPVAPSILVRDWLVQIRRIFLELPTDVEPIYGLILTVFFVVLVGYAIYFLLKTTNIRIWGFILALIIIPASFLVLPDISLGGIRSLSTRLMLPSYIGMQIAVAYLLAHNLYNGLAARKQVWQFFTVAILLFGLFACFQLIIQ